MILTTPFNSSFTEELAQSVEAWFALALVNDDGYNYLQESIPGNCIQHFLVGINLPTSPSVLRNLKSQNSFKARVFKSTQTFHPKMYLIKKQDGKFVAFVGSSNATSGGFQKNIEVNYKIEDQAHCTELLEWFKILYSNGYLITDDLINDYQKIYDKRVNRQKEDSKEIEELKLKKPNIYETQLGNIDFADQFFKREHYMAFIPVRWEDDSTLAIKERFNTADQLLELHELIYDKFKSRGLITLHKHFNPPNMTSSVNHKEGYTAKKLSSVWLHYGKSEHQIKKYEYEYYGDKKYRADNDENLMSFINHIRMQVIIGMEQEDKKFRVGTWLVLGKDNNGGLIDREYFRNEMNKQDKRESFFSICNSLPKDFWISIGSDNRYLESFKTSEALHDFTKSDRPSKYFIIGKTYLPDDSKISVANIKETVLEDFNLLFPLYEFMRDKKFN